MNKISSKEELLLIKELISSPLSKVHLRRVYLKIKSLDDAVDILDLLSECQHIEVVQIKYVKGSNSKMSDTKEIIKETKNMFIRKVGIINRLAIIHLD